MGEVIGQAAEVAQVGDPVFAAGDQLDRDMDMRQPLRTLGCSKHVSEGLRVRSPAVLDTIATDGARQTGPQDPGDARRCPAVLAHPSAHRLGPGAVGGDLAFEPAEPGDALSGGGLVGIERRAEGDDAGDEAGVPVGEGKCDEAAEGVSAHDERAGDTELIEDSAERTHMVVWRVAHGWAGRGAETEEIRHDEASGVTEGVVGGAPVCVGAAQAVEQQHPGGAMADRAGMERAVVRGARARRPRDEAPGGPGPDRLCGCRGSGYRRAGQHLAAQPGMHDA